MQAKRVFSKEIDRRIEQSARNLERLAAYRQRCEDNPTLVLLGSVQRCKWLRRQAD